MKLKTLKDLKIIEVPFKWKLPSMDKFHNGFGEYVEIDDVKTEAIKWVKEYGLVPSGIFCKFHNITKEDLE